MGANLDQSSCVQAVCDYYGPTDFTAFVSTPGYERHAANDSPEAKLIGGAVMQNKDKAARANSITYVSPDDPPFLIVHGDQDSTVPINQSQLLFGALTKAKVSAIKVGNGFEAGINQGPMIDDAAIAKVEGHVADALAKGAKVVVGGSRVPGMGERFYTPTVLADVTPEMLCSKEETFGPVAPVFRFKTEAEAIELANATEFGLASYFYSRDIGRIYRVGEALEYGMVGINVGILATEHVPFGGVKQSGLHMVNGRTRLPFAAIAIAGEISLGVLNAGLDIPQPVGPQVSIAHDTTCVDVLTVNRRGKAGCAHGWPPSSKAKTLPKRIWSRGLLVFSAISDGTQS